MVYRLIFRKGDKFEVQCKRDLPSGSWRPATLISGNGCTYYLKYDESNKFTDSPAIEKVPRKLIRPCAPLTFGNNWRTGDLVEVFDNYLWKTATISEIKDEGLFMVQFNGIPKKLRADKSHLRVPQSLEKYGWVIMGKKPVVQQVQQADIKTVVQESNQMSSRQLKRGSAHLSALVSNAGISRKMIVIGKEVDHCNRVPFPEHLTKLLTSVVASFNNKTIRHLLLDMKAVNQNGNVSCSIAGSLKPHDTESHSCSFNSHSCRAHDSSTSSDATESTSSRTLSCSSLANHGQGHDNDDVESLCDECTKQQTLPIKDRKKLSHEFELNKYRCVILSMFSSGYIT